MVRSAGPRPVVLHARSVWNEAEGGRSVRDEWTFDQKKAPLDVLMVQIIRALLRSYCFYTSTFHKRTFFFCCKARALPSPLLEVYASGG